MRIVNHITDREHFKFSKAVFDTRPYYLFRAYPDYLSHQLSSL
jgi:hypothetical protein